MKQAMFWILEFRRKILIYKKMRYIESFIKSILCKREIRSSDKNT